MDRLIKKLPIPIAGLMLGLAAAGNLVLSYGNAYRNVFGTLSAVILLLLIIKVLTEPKAVAEGFNNPIVASVMPTFSMGVMILSTYIKPVSSALAFGMWITGLLIHCLLIIFFTKKYILKFDIKKVFPTYFIVYVGIIAASVTGPAFNMAQLGQYAFWFGFICYLILLPVILYRVLAVKEIPEAAVPTLTIFAAPASLCLAGYMNSFSEKSMALVAFLGCLSLIMLIGVLVYLPKMLKIKFYPSYSAFTFPMVISGIAIKLTNGFLINAGKGIEALKYAVKFQEIIAVIMVIYVLLMYMKFLFAAEKLDKSSSIKA